MNQSSTLRRLMNGGLLLIAVGGAAACSKGSSSEARTGGTGGAGGAGGAVTGAAGGGAGGAGGAGALAAPWDWVGIVGTGQSLAVGANPVSSTTQPYHNLKLSLEGVTVPPWDSTNAAFQMVPLVEPIRSLATGYPGPYPGNIYGETPHSAMANQITSLVAAATGGDYVTVHTVVGESGQGIVALRKQTGDTTGTTGRAYAATVFEAEAVTRLAAAAGKTYGIGAIVMTHGETDCGSTTYHDDLIQLWTDYNADLSAITGQTQSIPMYLSQQHSLPNGATSLGWRSVATQAQWQLGVERPGDFVCTGPKYQYQGNADGVHLTVPGYRMLGEKIGQVYYERAVLGHDWQPLQPTTVERSGRVVTVNFHVPVPPLVWDESLDAPVIPEWVNGRGFELRSGGTNLTIASVAISGDSVAITADADLPASGVIVGYAVSSQAVQMTAASREVRWGQLRDSDPFVGSSTNAANPNYCVAFEVPVP
jgi:hypothetical protein